MEGGLGRRSPAQPPSPRSKAAQCHSPTARMACKAALVPEPPARSNGPGKEGTKGPAAEADARVAKWAPQGRAWHWSLGKGSPAGPFEHHTLQAWFTERIQAQRWRCFARQRLGGYSFLSKLEMVKLLRLYTAGYPATLGSSALPRSPCRSRRLQGGPSKGLGTTRAGATDEPEGLWGGGRDG